jgi:hypothetical protein
MTLSIFRGERCARPAAQPWRPISNSSWRFCVGAAKYINVIGARKPWVRLFCDHARLRAARISNLVQRLFLRCDKLFRARAENVGKLRQTLAEHMVVRAMQLPRTQRPAPNALAGC